MDVCGSLPSHISLTECESTHYFFKFGKESVIPHSKNAKILNLEKFTKTERIEEAGAIARYFISLFYRNSCPKYLHRIIQTEIKSDQDVAHSNSYRTTTTTTTSAIIINTGYLKSWPGLLKFAELILGIVVVGLVSYYINKWNYINTPELFFLLMAVTFLVGTFILLTACLISISTASIISKTIYEVVYHGFAFVLYLAAGLTFIVEVNHYKRQHYSRDYEPYFAAAIIGLIVSVLYLLSTIFALRSYRGM
ncbi:hypothetical protein JTB14_010912 [Gonioctena quinquepunctata]|nr:hypothetical protein JTB14_010912 [Gonioctena quinquepunctata]